MLTSHDIYKHYILNELFGIAEGATASTRRTIENGGTPLTDRDTLNLTDGLLAVDDGSEIDLLVNRSYAFAWKVSHAFELGLVCGTNPGGNGTIDLNSGSATTRIENTGANCVIDAPIIIEYDGAATNLGLATASNTNDVNILFNNDIASKTFHYDYADTRFEMDDDLVVTGDVSGTTIGGITEANLLDKTATESITGAYSFTTNITRIDGGLGINADPTSTSLNVLQEIVGVDGGPVDYRALDISVSGSGTGSQPTGVVCETRFIGDAYSYRTYTGGRFSALQNVGISVSNLTGGLFLAGVSGNAVWDDGNANIWIGGQFLLRDGSGAGTDRRIARGTFVDIRYDTQMNERVGFTTRISGIEIADLTDGFVPAAANDYIYSMYIEAMDGANSSAMDGNIYMAGGNWDNGHIQLEDGHIWNDATNNCIRVSGAAPTSEESGYAIFEDSWDDLRVAVSSLARGVNPGANSPDWGTFPSGENTYTLLFDDAQDEEVYFVAQLPHTYKQGSDIIPHVHWAPTSTDTGSVTWKLDYSWANVAATVGANTTISVTDAGDGTANKHQIAGFSAITGTAMTVSSMLICRLYRDVDDSDDYADDAALLEIDFHYQINSTGSDAETSKSLDV